MMYNYVKQLLSCDDHDGLRPITIFVFVLKKYQSVVVDAQCQKIEKKIPGIKK